MKTTMRKLPAAWLLVMVLLFPALTRAETAVQAWVQRYNGPANGLDQARALALDSSNNVVVTGVSTGSGSGSDYATIKYSSAGVPLWTNRYNGGPGSIPDYPFAVAVDGSNNVIVTGYSSIYYATIKYSSTGVWLWMNLYNGSGTHSDYPAATVVDGSNNVIVTGSSADSAGYYHYATIEYSSGGVPLWTNRYTGPGNYVDYATAVAVDGSNNVIVTGYSYGSGSSFNNDYATIEYSSAGVPLWTNRYNGPGNGVDEATAVAVDGSNSVIVTGYSAGQGSWDAYATISTSSTGVPLWTNRYAGPGSGPDHASAVGVDPSGNVVVTGYSTGSGGGYDYTTIKYSSTGVPLWTNRYNGPENGTDQASALKVDGNGNVIVTGNSTGSTSGLDYATIKYSAAGVPLWTNRYNGPGNGVDEATAAAVDHSGNVIVTGYSTGTGGDYDFATIKYICVPSPLMTGLQLTNGTFQVRVDDLLQPGTLVIEACTNLAGWAPVFTNTTPTNVLFYADPDASGSPTRFYRAFQFP